MPTNMIWIIADQLRADMLSCNGDLNVSTPHIDALAEGGVNFTRSVSTFPLCCPARGSFLTGLYPHHSTLGHEYRMPPDQITIADVLNGRGYHTAYIGKWHLDGWHEKDGRAAFHVVPPERRGGFAYWMGYENNNAQYDCYVHGGGADVPEQPPKKLEGYETDALTTLFLDHLAQRPKGKPFFAVLSVQPPHNPYVAPERNTHYDPEELILRPNMLPEIPRYDEFARYNRQNLANAYAMVENFDENVGRVISWLKEQNLYENTILMVFSDHGDCHGAHGWQRKTNPYEESIRVPFIIGGMDFVRDPSLRGGRLPYVFSTVDVAPTTLGLLNVPVPHNWEGYDYADAARRKAQDFSLPESAYIQSIIPEHHPHSTELPWRGIVTQDGWKYVCLEGMPWMLFDLNNDPYELRNMAYYGLARRERPRLHALLEDWIRRTGDVFTLPEIEASGDLSEHARDVFGYPEYGT